MSSRRRVGAAASFPNDHEREFDRLLRQAARILKKNREQQQKRERQLLTNAGKAQKKRAPAA